MNKSLLITGGSGLLALNWALDTRDSWSITLARHRRNISLAGVETCVSSLESSESVVQMLKVVRPNIVVHTAGLTNVAECESKPDVARRVNVELAANVAEGCAQLGLPFVHISTDHLFSGQMPLVNEDQPVMPKNIYARTKAEAEQRVLEVHPQSLIIRTNFYGWGPSYRQSFSDIVIDSLREKKILTLYQDVYYTPILIAPLVRAIHDLIDLQATGIFNVVGEERLSKYEFGVRLAREFKLDPSIIAPGLLADQGAVVQRPRDMSLSNKKIRALLGRNLGSVGDHLAQLHFQERIGLAQEMKRL
jgi:dTDP-4-dehydrorhamnose reductase